MREDANKVGKVDPFADAVRGRFIIGEAVAAQVLFGAVSEEGVHDSVTEWVDRQLWNDWGICTMYFMEHISFYSRYIRTCTSHLKREPTLRFFIKPAKQA